MTARAPRAQATTQDVTSQEVPHWAHLGESTFVAGMWLLYQVHRFLGRWPFLACLYPVVAYYWLAKPVARRASLQYLQRMQAAHGLWPRMPGWRQSQRHFRMFAQVILDKLLALSGRYRFDRVDAEAAVMRPNDSIGDTGLRGGFGWQFNDRWHAGVTAARNDPEASMQARVAGITADSVAVAVDYTRNERTHWSIGGSQFRYDDGNRRDTLNSAIEQRLLTRPRLLIDGLGSVYTSRGSRDDAPYFNPSRDRSVEVGLRIDQQLWRHYERHFRHRLTVSVGNYWQEGFGSSIIPTVAYRHEWQFDQGRILEYGVSWSRPVYDGQRERHIGFDAALRWGE